MDMGAREMILSEFIRIIDISWTDFLWMVLWFILITGTYTAVVYSTAWTISRETFNKNIMDQMMNGIISIQKAEIKQLKAQLIKSQTKEQNYKDRLLAIKNSSEVRGI